MRFPAFLIALSSIAALAACGGDSGDGGTTTPPPAPGSIAGQVSTSSGAVSGAQVTLSPGGAFQTTGGSGAYRFDNLQQGSYTLAIQLPQGFALGSEAATKTVTVSSGQTAAVNWTVQPQNTGGGTQPRVEVIGASNSQFERADITIPVGTTVRWVNNDPIFHNVVAENNAFPSGDLPNRGSTYSFTFSTPGTFRYRCTPHSQNFTSGMVGVIRVQ